LRILFIDTVHPLLKKKLEQKKYLCDTAYNEDKTTIKNKIHIYDGIIIRSKFGIDKPFIDAARKLKFIARAGSGLENIDIDYLKKKGIYCYNAGEGNKIAVAEHCLAMLLSLLNNLNRASQQVKNGIWNREENRGIELSGKTIAIIGYGNTGSAFKKILESFNVNILIYDKYLKTYPYKSSMEDIYKKADIISLHIPLTKETKYIIDKKSIKRFNKSFYLINTSRGKCVKTQDLIFNLKNKKIIGACLDVVEEESSSFEKVNKKNIKELTNMPNVIITPHIAGWTIESNIKIAEKILEKINSDFP
tara:strand:- start:690 stop:1604 length:915 start_codon:yes stop_codon:yes gene_type:complete